MMSQKQLVLVALFAACAAATGCLAGADPGAAIGPYCQRQASCHDHDEAACTAALNDEYIVLRAASIDEARTIAEADPFIQGGFETVEVRTLHHASKENNFLLDG